MKQQRIKVEGHTLDIITYFDKPSDTGRKHPAAHCLLYEQSPNSPLNHTLIGQGSAFCNPADEFKPEIGERLAIKRAVNDAMGVFRPCYAACIRRYNRAEGLLDSLLYYRQRTETDLTEQDIDQANGLLAVMARNNFKRCRRAVWAQVRTELTRLVAPDLFPKPTDKVLVAGHTHKGAA